MPMGRLMYFFMAGDPSLDTSRAECTAHVEIESILEVKFSKASYLHGLILLGSEYQCIGSGFMSWLHLEKLQR